MDEKEKVFAYLFLSGDFDSELESDLVEYYWGGIIEAFIDCEEQWVDSAGLWPFGWGSHMDRVSVVQIVINDNPCHWISKLCSEGVIHPTNVKEYDDGAVTVFKKNEINWNALEKLQPESPYFERFVELLESTVMSSTCHKDIIFIGGRGFSADFELDATEQQLLRQVGLQISSRMPS